MNDVYRKAGTARAVRSEVASLRWLARADGAPVVEIDGHGEDWLATRRLPDGQPSSADAAEFGRGLARTHAAGADWFGQPPPGLDPADLGTGNLAKPAVAAATWETWGAFAAEARVAPYIEQIDGLDDDGRQVLRRAADALASGRWDSPQPSLCGDVARIHGDLWGGNVVWTPRGVLIDACAYGGHAESDLADLALFGSAHLAATIGGYCEVSDLADGWEDRIPAHQFHMVLIHAVLFGGSYVGRALQLARDLAR